MSASRTDCYLWPRTGAARLSSLWSRAEDRVLQGDGLQFLLYLIPFLLYLPVLGYPFVNFDDPFYVVNNPDVARGLSFGSLGHAFVALQGFYHPITWLSLALDAHLFGRRAGCFHLTNLWIHLANTVLLYRLVRRGFRDRKVAFATALLFAIHPANVEAVAWVSERKGLLAALFCLAGLHCYWTFLDGLRIRDAVGALLFQTLSLLSKPAYLAFFPGTLVLLTFLPRYRVVADGAVEGSARHRRAAGLAFCLFGLVPISATVAVLTLVSERRIGALAGAITQGMGARLSEAPWFYLQSLGNAVMPDWGTPVRFSAMPGAGAAWAALGVCAVITWAAWRIRSTAPGLWFGWVGFMLALLPVCGLVRIGDQIGAHRYLYLATPCLWLGLLAALLRLTGGARWGRGAVWLGVVALTAAYWVRSGQLLPMWSGSEVLWATSLEHAPSNWIAQNNLGALDLERRELGRAEREFWAALAAGGLRYAPLVNLGQVWGLQGKDGRALIVFGEAERLAPNDARVHLLLATVYGRRGQWSDARAQYEAAATLAPRDGVVLTEYATFLTEHHPDHAELLEALALENRAREAALKLNHGADFEYHTMLARAGTARGLGRQVEAHDRAFEAMVLASRVHDTSVVARAAALLRALEPEGQSKQAPGQPSRLSP